MYFLLPIALPVLGLAAITRFHLRGENLSKYDKGFPLHFNGAADTPGLQKAAEWIEETFIKPAQKDHPMHGLAGKRKMFEDFAKDRRFPVTFKPLMISAPEAPDMSGEWALAKAHDPNRRLLYLHGGGMTVGSARSHRTITAKLAELTGASVCAVNYRLMPENTRQDGIDDCRTAYLWLLENGPNGTKAAKAIAIAGDSAGANQTLSLLNYIKAKALPAPNCAVAISAHVDSTFTSPSIHTNFATDIMLQPLVKPLLKVPKFALLWAAWKQTKIVPSDPKVSPIFGDLSGLPPVLVQVSATEMLLDDCQRYVAKAQTAGSDARIQIWNHMPHVWHMFEEFLPEARDALAEIAAFMKEFGVGQ